MGREAFLFLGITLAIAGTSYAQTAEEQAACRSDAIKYCRNHVGKQDDMKKCLLSNKEQLSSACKKVVEARGG